MEKELDDEGRVLLMSETHGTICDHREEEIEPDTHHVGVRCICMRSPSEGWVDCDISVGAIDEVVNILHGGGEFPDDSCLSRRPVEEADGYDAECPVCGSDEYEGEVLAFAFKPMDHRRDKCRTCIRSATRSARKSWQTSSNGRGITRTCFLRSGRSGHSASSIDGSIMEYINSGTTSLLC